MKVTEKDTNVGLGTPSLILIVLVVTMSVFALLALRSARGEKKLASKTAESVKNFYMLDSETEETIAAIDGIVRQDGEEKEKKISGIKHVINVETVKTNTGSKAYKVTMYVKMSEEDSMGIAAKVEFPEEDEDLNVLERRLVKEEAEDGYSLVLPD